MCTMIISTKNKNALNATLSRLRFSVIIHNPIPTTNAILTKNICTVKELIVRKAMFATFEYHRLYTLMNTSINDRYI